MMFNTDIFGGLTSRISSSWDRVVSFVENMIDLVKSKLRTLWEHSRTTTIALGAIAAVAVSAVIIFFPAVTGIIGSIVKGLASIVSAVINRISRIISRILGGRGA